MAELLKFPQGAMKGVGTSTLTWLKSMPFRDREELTEWLLSTATAPDDPIRPRTDSERKAYIMGFADGYAVTVNEGSDKARSELKIMFECEEGGSHGGTT